MQGEFALPLGSRKIVVSEENKVTRLFQLCSLDRALRGMCLVITAPRSAQLYRKLDGVVDVGGRA